MAETFSKGSVSVGGALDPKKYTGPTEKLSLDALTKKMLAFGPEGPPLDFDPRSFEVDESSIGPRKVMRGTGFPAEDAPMTPDYDMTPGPYEPSIPKGMSYRRDSMSGKMVLMPDERMGDGRRWSRGKLLDPDYHAYVPTPDYEEPW